MPSLGYPRTRVMIIDDHVFMRRGLAQTIQDEPGLTVCGEAGSISEALKQFPSPPPDVAIVDISLADGSGIDLVRKIKDDWPATKILVSSMHEESLFAERAIRAGAQGFVNKSEHPDTFLAALKQVAAGQIYLSHRMTHRMLDLMLGESVEDKRSPIERLSNRELQVFEMLGRGMVTKQIAYRLGLSHKTIETYREHIKQKLGLSNACELTRHAVQWVLESKPQPLAECAN